MNVKIAVNRLLGLAGYHLKKGVAGAPPPPPSDFDEPDLKMWKRIQPYTLITPERMYSASRAIEYIVRGGVPGAIVECGVWKGGSALGMALALLDCGDTSRDFFLYDTFDEGWPAAGPEDVMRDGTTPHQLWLDAVKRGDTTETLFAQYESVARLLKNSGYPNEKIHLVQGKVEDTIPGVAPDQIALLRLDTDWYESTKHELKQLYPRLSNGGVLIIDDYGLWKGARKATDEYFAENGINMLLHRADALGYRIGVKTSP